jgi:DNA-binding transcriptional LysR family regulator
MLAQSSFPDDPSRPAAAIAPCENPVLRPPWPGANLSPALFRKADLQTCRSSHTFEKQLENGAILADLEWSDFKVILALSRGGSVAAAGRILGVDSSTVSRRLAAVEEALGACLVLRGGREFRFTAEGTLALRTAEALETSILSTAAAIKSAKQAIEGSVKVTCVGAFFHVLEPICEKLHQKYPGLSVEVLDSDEMINLAAGDADVAIRMAAPKEPDLIARKAFDLGWCVYASKDYAATYGLPKDPEELRQHRLILFGEKRLHLEQFRLLERFKSGNDSFIRVNSNEVALRVVLAGGGIATLPAFEAGQHDLVRVFPQPQFSHTAYLVYHESQKDSARIRAVVDELMAYLASKKSMLLGQV